MDEDTDLDREAERQRALASAHPTCPYCGTALSRHQAISPGHCGGGVCVARHVTQATVKREEDRAEDIRNRRELARDHAAEPLTDLAMMLGATPDQTMIAPVPFQDKPLIPLPGERRRAFEAHLDEILTEAFAIDDDVMLIADPSDPAPEPAIVDAACAACQGNCCALGAKKNAFLTPQTMVHLIRADPALTPEDLREDYLAALPEVSVENACVYQSDQGCSLPRARRGSVCNSFYCHDLYALQEQTEGRSDLPVVFVAMEEDIPRKAIGFDGRMGGIVATLMLDETDK